MKPVVMDLTGLSSICVLAIPCAPNLSAARWPATARLRLALAPARVRARRFKRAGVVQFYQTRRAAAQAQDGHPAGLNLNALEQVDRRAQIKRHRQLDRVGVAEDGHQLFGMVAG